MGRPDRRAFIDLLNESPATGKSMPVLVFCSVSRTLWSLIKFRKEHCVLRYFSVLKFERFED